MQRAIPRLEKLIVEVEDFDVSTLQKRFSAEIQTLETRIKGALDSILGPNTVEYNRYRAACHLDEGPGVIRSDWMTARGYSQPDEGSEGS